MAFNQIVKRYSGKFATILMLTAALTSCFWASEESEDMGRYFFSGDGEIQLLRGASNSLHFT